MSPTLTNLARRVYNRKRNPEYGNKHQPPIIAISLTNEIKAFLLMGSCVHSELGNTADTNVLIGSLQREVVVINN